MDALHILELNALCREGSFIYDLHEESTFSVDKLKTYFDCVFQLATNNLQLPLGREMSWMVMKSYSYIIRSIMWHYAPDDISEIKGLPPYSELVEYLHDLDVVVQSYFDGEELTDRSTFSL